jgi:OmpA-OmpF porin, OOP family
MRCNWRRWLWGVIPLVGVSVAAVHLERGAVEKDLTDRARGALAAAGATWADVNFSGRDVVLTGNATVENEPPEAEAVLSRLWGVRLVNNNAALPPKVEPFLWHATRRGDRVRLYGNVPNRETRQIIIGMTNAALPGLEVTDRMRTARGVPPTDTWLAGLSFAVKQLAALKKGEVRLEGLALTVSGEAETAAEYRAVSAAIKGGLPKGITLAGLQVAAPVVSPYTWSAQFAGGQLVLSGHVADDGAKAELLAAAAAAPAGTGVVDRQESARGAPADFAAAAAALIRQIARLQSGNAEMKDTAVTVGGVAADETQLAAIREALRGALPPAFKLTDQMRVRELPKAELKVEPKVEAAKVEEPKAEPPKAEPKIEATPPAEPTVSTGQKTAALSKADMQPAAGAPGAGGAEDKVNAQSAVQQGAAPPETTTASATPPAAELQSAPAPAPPAAAEPAKDAAPPAATPVETPQTTVATAVLPPPAPEPAAPAAPVAPAPAPPAAAAPPPVSDPAPPAVDFVACRDDLARLAAGSSITFERGSAVLDAAGVGALAKIAAAAKACPGVRITAEGHTDVEGGPDYNQRLSVKRAQAVAERLIKDGVSTELIETAGFGAKRPVAPNSTAQARARNRRTEILVRPK